MRTRAGACARRVRGRRAWRPPDRAPKGAAGRGTTTGAAPRTPWRRRDNDRGCTPNPLQRTGVCPAPPSKEEACAPLPKTEGKAYSGGTPPMNGEDGDAHEFAEETPLLAVQGLRRAGCGRGRGPAVDPGCQGLSKRRGERLGRDRPDDAVRAGRADGGRGGLPGREGVRAHAASAGAAVLRHVLPRAGRRFRQTSLSRRLAVLFHSPRRRLPVAGDPAFPGCLRRCPRPARAADWTPPRFSSSPAFSE